jgi:hypothetical protein
LFLDQIDDAGFPERTVAVRVSAIQAFLAEIFSIFHAEIHGCFFPMPAAVRL